MHLIDLPLKQSAVRQHWFPSGLDYKFLVFILLARTEHINALQLRFVPCSDSPGSSF